MQALRRLVLWIAIRVPLGPLTPRMFAFGLSADVYENIPLRAASMTLAEGSNETRADAESERRETRLCWFWVAVAIALVTAIYRFVR